MYTVPKFASNKKYWLLINRLVFGDEVACPQCSQALQENYHGHFFGARTVAVSIVLPAIMAAGYTV